MKPPITPSRKPAFRWGDVEEWVRTLSGPKIEDLHNRCVGLIARFEFARSNPESVWRFDGTPDLNDDGVSLGEFTMFKRRLRLDYNEEDREYVLNFAVGLDRDPPRAHRRRSRGRRGQSGSGATAQAAAMRQPRRRRSAERILLISYKTCWRRALPLRQMLGRLVRRAPRLRLEAARIRELFIGLSQPLADFPRAGARLAPKEFLIGAGLTFLLHSFERESTRLWEPALFGELPRESERLLA